MATILSDETRPHQSFECQQSSLSHLPSSLVSSSDIQQYSQLQHRQEVPSDLTHHEKNTYSKDTSAHPEKEGTSSNTIIEFTLKSAFVPLNKTGSSTLNNNNNANDHQSVPSSSLSPQHLKNNNNNNVLGAALHYSIVPRHETNRVEANNGQSQLSMKQREIKDRIANGSSTIGSTTANNELLYDRTPKVAKTRYSDHGAHGVIVNASCHDTNSRTSSTPNNSCVPHQQQSVLKKVTCLLETSYKNVVNNNTDSVGNADTDKHTNTSYLEGIAALSNRNRKRGSPRAGITTNIERTDSETNSTQVSDAISRTMNIPQGTSLLSEQVGNDVTGLHNKNNPLPSNLSTLMNETRALERKKTPPAGLLHAALMGNGLGGDDSVNNINSTKNAALHSLSHPNSKLGNNVSEPIKKCLTNPSTPKLNNGLDNIDGNLIVHMHDEIRVPNQNIHQHHHSSSSKDQKPFIRGNKYNTTKFEVLGLLGQGTFAQVFKCKKIDTGEMVAIKIVKNKPAYTRQAAIEIDIFQALEKKHQSSSVDTHADICIDKKCGKKNKSPSDKSESTMVSLLGYFMYHSHLCLVFELLGLNLYEVLKQRQFCGLPINEVRELVKQATNGIKQLSLRNIVHCDLKPENILLSDNSTINISDEKSDQDKDFSGKHQSSDSKNKSGSSFVNSIHSNIKLIDFGSACFEGQTTHTYIQSRFYRSPEVLMGLDYDSAIDMWSLGCVAAELFLGLPILPGLHEHDQLGRICEMIGDIPNWMIEQGTKSSQYFEKNTEQTPTDIQAFNGKIHQTKFERLGSGTSTSPSIPHQSWRLKTRERFIMTLSEDEIERRGGLKKLEQQPTNRYFKRKILADIVMDHGACNPAEDHETLSLFVHFLKGILDPDPWKRWTAHQASMHPFITGNAPNIRRSSSGLNIQIEKRQPQEIYWVPPWDPSICRRKLLCVQKARDRQQTSSRSSRISGTSISRSFVPETAEADLQNHYNPENISSPDQSSTIKVTAMTDAMSLSQSLLSKSETQCPSDTQSPPMTLGPSIHSTNSISYGNANPMRYPSSNLSCSLGTDTAPHQYEIAHSMSETNRYRNSSLSQLHAPPLLADYARFLMQPPPTNLQATGQGQREFLPPYQQVASCVGPQSYSGVYYESIPGGDLGYALQRPGVVPMGGESMSTNSTLPPTQIHQSGPPTNIGSQGRSLSLSSSKPTNQGVTRRASGNFHNYGPNSYSALAVASAQGFIPTSPHDNSKSRLRPGSFNDNMQSCASRSSFSDSIPDMRNLNGTSFLAQKLAEHSTRNKNQSGNKNQSWTDSQFVHVPNSMPNQTSYSYSNNSSMLYDGTPQNSLHNVGYVSAHGTPLFMSTSNPVIIPRQAASSYSNNGIPYLANQNGSYQDNLNSHSLSQQQMRGYPPVYSQQSNYFEMSNHQ